MDVFDLVTRNSRWGATWTHLNAQTQEDLIPPMMGPLAQLAAGASGALTGK